MRTQAKILKISTFSELLELTNGLQQGRAFIQEKWLNLDGSSGLCGILTCPISISFFPVPQKSRKPTDSDSQTPREPGAEQPLNGAKQA